MTQRRTGNHRVHLQGCGLLRYLRNVTQRQDHMLRTARFKPRHWLGQGSTGRHHVAGREQVVQLSNLGSIVPFAAGSEAAKGRAAAAVVVVVAAGLCRAWEPWLSVSPRENAAPAQSRRITLQGRGHQAAVEGAGLPGTRRSLSDCKSLSVQQMYSLGNKMQTNFSGFHCTLYVSSGLFSP